jgi:ribosome-associated protein
MMMMMRVRAGMRPVASNSVSITTSDFFHGSQRRFMARRITREELDSSVDAEQQDKNKLEIEKQLKFIHDYQQELSQDLKDRNQFALSDSDIADYMYEDGMEDGLLDDQCYSDEVNRYIEIENMKQMEEAKAMSDQVNHSPHLKANTAIVPPTLEDFIDLLNKDLAQDMIVMDIRKKCTFASWCIFVTGTSFRHMRMMSNHVVDLLKERKMFYLNPCVEGKDCEDWMVVDCGDIFVHVFSPKGREYYDLERKWAFQKVEDYEPFSNMKDNVSYEDLLEIAQQKFPQIRIERAEPSKQKGPVKAQ